METKCKNHPEKTSFNFCHNCHEYFCLECLNEGDVYYYCDQPICYQKYEQEITNRPRKEVKIYASFPYRLTALTIDAIILFIANSLIFILLRLAEIQISPNDVLVESNWFMIFRHPLSYFTGLVYFSIMESSGKMGTIGKRMQGIRVITKNGRRISFGRALARNFFRLFTTLSIIGYFLPLFLTKKQALHDLLCGTLVINEEANTCFRE